MNATLALRRIVASTTLLVALAMAAVVARPAQADTVTFTQTTDITCPDLGYCNPVPSNLAVANVKGTLTKLVLHLENFSSGNPRDMDLLLVSPDGKAVVPISDAGGTLDVAGLEFDFDDASPNLPSLAGPLTAGTYKPSDSADPNELMGMGAPDPPHGASFGTFNGINPNGTWSLYGFSDFFDGGGSSSIDDWRLTVTGTPPALKIKAKRQALKKKLKFTATSTTDATLVASGGIKTKTVELKANVATPIKALIKVGVRKRLAALLDDGRKAKVKVNGTVTDVTGATTTTKTKAKLKG